MLDTLFHICVFAFFWDTEYYYAFFLDLYSVFERKKNIQFLIYFFFTQTTNKNINEKHESDKKNCMLKDLINNRIFPTVNITKEIQMYYMEFHILQVIKKGLC